MSRAVGVIPARWGSTRLPGKALVPLCGKPLIQWVWERAKSASRLDRLLIATDDDRIEEAVCGFGGVVARTREDHPSGTDRVAEAVKDLDADIVINIQGDEPMIHPALIDDLVDTLDVQGSEWDMVTAAQWLEDRAEALEPSVVKVVCASGGQALYFSRAPIPFIREETDIEDATRTYLKHVGIYGYRKPFLERLVRTAPSSLEQLEKLEQLRALHIGGRIRVVMTDYPEIAVDEPKDVALAEAALRSAGMA